MCNLTQKIRRRMKGYMLKVMPGMITCCEFENFIVDYLEGDLPEKQRTLFERHLRLCRECRDYLAAYQLTQELCRGLRDDPEAPIPQDVPEDLVTAVLESRHV